MAGKEVKRGRLRRVTIHPMHDDEGNVTGHRVTAEHEPDRSSMPSGKEPSYTPYPPDIETANGSTETTEGAAAVAKDHLDDNAKRFGGKKKKSASPNAENEQAMRSAMGRKGY